MLGRPLANRPTGDSVVDLSSAPPAGGSPVHPMRPVGDRPAPSPAAPISHSVPFVAEDSIVTGFAKIAPLITSKTRLRRILFLAGMMLVDG